MTAFITVLAASSIMSAPLMQTSADTVPPHEIPGAAVTGCDCRSVTLSWQDFPKGVYITAEDENGTVLHFSADDTESFTASGLAPDNDYNFRLYPLGTPFGRYMSVSAHTAEYKNTKDVSLDTPVWDQLSGNTAYYGCGPTCMGMILYSEKGISLTKDDILRAAYDSGNWYNVYQNFSNAWTSYAGATLEYVAGYASLYGCEGNYDLLSGLSDEQIIEKINMLLDNGHRIIIGHRKKESGAHHYAVICGKSVSDGRSVFSVIDPYGGVKYQWSETDLLDRLNAVDMTNDFTRQVRGIVWLS